MSAIPKIPRTSGGFAPLGPLPGFYPGPAGDIKRSPDPSPTHAPLTTNPGSAPGCHLSNRRFRLRLVYIKTSFTEDY
jgi:hypothetical protein